MKRLLLLLTIAGTAMAQRVPPPASSCPLLASLASSKVHSDRGDSIVIFFWNQGKKTIHGAQFLLLMLDTGGNKYPASQHYLVTADVKPNNGDVVVYPATDEEKHFGENWKNIEGVEVFVTSILFTDATTWKPTHGVVCKTAFLNANYDKELKRSGEDWRKKWNREHSDDKIPDSRP